jgi:protein-disulfide isomerase
VQQYLDAGKVRISYHMIAFLNGDSTTKYSERAANAMAAVYDTSGPTVAKKFHDLLYLHQPPEGTAGLANSQLVAYAVRAGAPRAAISAAVSHGSFDQWVVNATDAMSKAGVTGTPTVFVDGHRLPENLSTTALSTSLKRQIDAKTP